MGDPIVDLEIKGHRKERPIVDANVVDDMTVEQDLLEADHVKDGSMVGPPVKQSDQMTFNQACQMFME